MTDWKFIFEKWVLGRHRVKNPSEEAVEKEFSRTRGRVFVDVGANIGRYAIRYAGHFKEVYAIEPNPEILEQLSAKAEQCLNVKVFPYAMANMDGETTLYLNKEEPPCSGTADTILPVFHYRPASNPQVTRETWQHQGIMVKTVRYDSVFPGPVDFVKIDVEGAEFLVLEGMRKGLKNGNVKKLIIELHDREQKTRLETVFSTFGYATRWLDPDHLLAWTR